MMKRKDKIFGVQLVTLIAIVVSISEHFLVILVSGRYSFAIRSSGSKQECENGTLP